MTSRFVLVLISELIEKLPQEGQQFTLIAEGDALATLNMLHLPPPSALRLDPEAHHERCGSRPVQRGLHRDPAAGAPGAGTD
ncbi:MAG: hypothetical protein ACRDGN_13965 [bacterium]